jgi:hypothetical protein
MNTTTTARRAWRLGAACALACQLAACGGGGGGGPDNGGGWTSQPLQVTFDYREAANVFQPSTIHPLLDGLQGHAAHCTLENGHLPAGLALNPDCTISGTATEFGVFAVQIHLTVAGSTYSSYPRPTIVVAGPRAEYYFDNNYPQGATLDLAPQADASFAEHWTPAPGMTVTYSVDTGALPAGVQLDAATGRLQGTLTAPGAVDAFIGAHVSYGGQTAAETSHAQFYVNPVALAGIYRFTSVYRGDPFTIDPTLPALAGATFSFAISPDPNSPIGSPVTIDAATGRISGVILDDPYTTFTVGTTVAVTMDYAGQRTVTQVAFPVGWDEPVDVQYTAPTLITVGQFASVAPTLTVRDPQRRLADYSFTFSLPYWQSLPAGLSMDPATGVISGTPTQRGCVVIQPAVKATVDGRSFNEVQRVRDFDLQVLDAQGNCG